MLFNEARWRAAAIGAQGLIIVDLKGPSNKSLMASKLVGTLTWLEGEYLAIRY